MSHGYNGDIRHNGNINNPQIDNDYSTEHYSDTALSNVVSSSTINRELQQATAEVTVITHSFSRRLSLITPSYSSHLTSVTPLVVTC